MLMLSPSGEEFSVEFICNLSQCQNKLYSVEGFSCMPQGSSGGQQHESKPISEAANDQTKEAHQGGGRRKSDCKRSRFCSPKITTASQPKVRMKVISFSYDSCYLIFSPCLFQPELVYQSTTVVQQQSCRSLNPLWSYPLSLARHIWSTCLSKAADRGTDEETPHRKTEMPLMTERQSRLPQALPLTCPSPHWHRLV